MEVFCRSVVVVVVEDHEAVTTASTTTTTSQHNFGVHLASSTFYNFILLKNNIIIGWISFIRLSRS